MPRAFLPRETYHGGVYRIDGMPLDPHGDEPVLSFGAGRLVAL